MEEGKGPSEIQNKQQTSDASSSQVSNSEQQCAICWESLAGPGRAIFTAECAHTFHFNCIVDSVKFGNHVCPVCRSTWKSLPFQYNNPLQQNPSIQLGLVPQLSQNPIVHVPQSLHNPNQFRRFSHLPSDDNIHYSDDEPLDVNPPAESASSSAESHPWTVTLKALPEVPDIVASQSVPVFPVLVNVQAPCLSDNAPDVERAHIDLVLVLDVSGSMMGAKISLLKRAVQFIIDNLGSSDRLSMVAFSSQARRIFPLRRMTDVGRRDAIRAVDALNANGSTNIVLGLKKGVRVFDERRQRNAVSSIIFLSDGIDTDNGRGRMFNNIASSDLRQVPEYLNLLPNSIYPHRDEVQENTIPVHSFGLGPDHDSVTMHAIADVSSGTYSFIESISIIQDAFARCIGGLLSVVVQKLQLTMRTLSPGVHIVSIPSGRHTHEISQEGRQGVITVGDLYADERKDFLVHLSIPVYTSNHASLETGEKTQLLDIKCSYRDAMTEESVHVECDRVEIGRPEVLSPEDVLINLEVDRQRNRLMVTESIAEARRLADGGNISDAQTLLNDRISTLRCSTSAQARDEFCNFLEAEMVEIRERMRSREVYENAGRAHLLAGLSSHSVQRATTRSMRAEGAMSFGAAMNCGGGCYSTPSISKMVKKSNKLNPTIPSENCGTEQRNDSGDIQPHP